MMKDSQKEALRARLANTGWFGAPGAYVLVDGQFGSTGKGLVAAALAELFPFSAGVNITNAGPNSGHTSYFGDEKVILKQLPTYGVTAHLLGANPTIYLSHGAVIDPPILAEEIHRHKVPKHSVMVSPNAAVITDDAKVFEEGIKSAIGSTGKGVGAAIMQKVMRQPKGVVGAFQAGDYLIGEPEVGLRALVEVSQGYSLGLNAGFYPFCTSRDCTVGAALSDAAIHPSFLQQTMMVVRTYPIRVGGNSGPCYSDQREIEWTDLGVEPERTTVTNKIRRVFTWSEIQFQQALLANRPEHIFVNFLNYLKPEIWGDWIEHNVIRVYTETLGYPPLSVMLGKGPRSEDIGLWK